MLRDEDVEEEETAGAAEEEDEATEVSTLDPAELAELDTGLDERPARRGDAAVLDPDEAGEVLREPEDAATLGPLTEIRVVPKLPHEFVCSSCYLIRHQSQLADRDRQVCLDCAA
jgi:hypothetical protein